MTNRERYIACAIGKPIDRTPFPLFRFGMWGETYDAWRNQGIDDPWTAWKDGFGFDPPVICINPNVVKSLFYPPIESKILERRGDVLVMQDSTAQIVERMADTDSLPRIIKPWVSDMEDWKKLKKERLDPNSPGRFPENWKERVEAWKKIDAPIQIGAYPCGLYGTLRDLMGVEESLYAFYDDPDLVHAVMDDLTDFWLAIFEKICADVQVDVIHIWEDMSGKHGSLISPDVIREFMLPNYRKIRAFADAHNIPIVQVDTDGDCEMLIPLFYEAGINMMLPFECTEKMDVCRLRAEYPYMAMEGGIDKNKVAKGHAECDKELERIRPLLGKPGYFPTLDHLIPPEMSFDDYAYFVRKLRAMVFGEE